MQAKIEKKESMNKQSIYQSEMVRTDGRPDTEMCKTMPRHYHALPLTSHESKYQSIL